MSSGTPKKLLVFDAITIIVGIIIGAGIFKTPSLVASLANGEGQIVLFWSLGGLISLLGAFCFAELASTYPGQGGDYFYISRAFGKPLGFLFAWARMSVIQTGSIAMLSFLAAEYLSQLIDFHQYSSFIAALLVIGLTTLNLAGLSKGGKLQKLLVSSLLLGLFTIGFYGFSINNITYSLHSPTLEGGLGKILIFVLLTYGGWNEAVYLSAELERKKIVTVLICSIAIVTAVYLIVNFAYLKGLGINGMAQSDAVAADLMRKVAGESGAKFISLLITIAALGTINGSIITGARTSYAVGKDFHLLNFLGKWDNLRSVPRNAVIFQGFVALLLVIVGSFSRDGFAAMVEFTAPVFWFFFLLSTLSLFILRKRDPQRERPFRVTFFPVVPILFAGICLFMFFSSLKNTAWGAATGLLIVLSGLPLLFLNNIRRKDEK